MHASLSSGFGLSSSLVAAPSGPATGTLSATMPGASTIRTRGRDGSVTTVVVAGLGDIVAFTTTRPDHRVSFEA